MVFGEIFRKTDYNNSYIDGVKFRKLAKGLNFKGEGFLYKFEESIIKAYYCTNLIM